ncbi:acyl-CoA dehydrogenase family protein, partial [bacterium]|nr:acyl-CoA dehydrogenase family protein [bacterium]
MDFNYTKAEKMLQSSVREYMKKNIIPIADEYDRKGPMSKEDAVRFLKELHPFGYVGSMVPEEDGGPGLSYMEYSILGLELRKAYASLGGIVGITSAVALMVAQSDNQMIKEKCLPGLLSGDKIGATAISEPDAGSDPSDMKTTAVLKGDHYVVNGVKMWISNGSIADYIMLVCMDATNGEGRENIFRILVERDVSPFEANEI